MPKRKTQEQFEKDVYDRLGPEYQILEPYPGSHGKVLMRHLKCGNTFKKNVHDIITKSSGCPYCNGSKPAKYDEQWVIDNTPKGYKYISGYKGMSKKCIFYCETCKINFQQTPRRLITEKIYGCNCCPTKKITHEQFLEILGEECLQEYEVLEEYINSDTKIKFKHKTCGTIFELSPYKFMYSHNKKYCPICYYKKSHGEIYINTYLKNHSFEYKKEFTFSDLPNHKFDFFLPKENAIIEFDGEQHYKYVPFFHRNIENFYERCKKDKEKNRYCLEKNIKLYRIPYTEIDNIYDILEQIFEEKSSTTIEKFLVKNEVEQGISE